MLNNIQLVDKFYEFLRRAEPEFYPVG
jgi:hypothetical protein